MLLLVMMICALLAQVRKLLGTLEAAATALLLALLISLAETFA